ncbi:type IV pilus secretin PilQ [Plesiocystis pacifica SIR-1]|uniref:Type IV pilus secretin PilQ n=1 Tax=Plesiocystis pacifica SIR-1 TaxID=391625 RepID=A6GHB7_9BACT|nr:type IV pilus secretin PilQ [Plesiocystis pacifica]EDM74732.1 type IV pilus secretin PilQ [Plesiocystis pacifica SIR-1]
MPAMLVLTMDGPAEAGSPKAKSASKRSRSADQANRIDGLTVEELEDGTTILRLSGHVEPTFNVYRLSSPDRLVVDVSASERGEAVPHVPVDSWAVGRVSIRSVEERDSKLARVTVELKREASYIVVPKGKDLVITVTPKEVAPEAYFARKSAGKRQAEIQSMEAAAERKVDKAESRAAEAERRVDSAESKAKQAEKRATEAAKRAKSAETEAERIRAEAERIRAAAEAEAERVEEDARKRAKEIESEAADTLLEARKVADARVSEAEALAAERKALVAERRAAQAQAEALAAQESASQAQAEAARANSPEALLSDADAAMDSLRREVAQAERSESEADEALADARKASRQAGKKASKQKRAALERAVDQAASAVEGAKKRAKQAKAELAAMKRERQVLADALASSGEQATTLRENLMTRGEQLAAAERELGQARDAYQALGGDEGAAPRKRRAHRRAKANLSKAQARFDAAQDEAEREQAELAALTAGVHTASAALGERLAAHAQGRSLKHQWEAERAAAGEAAVRDVRFIDGPDSARIVVELDGPVVYDASSLTPTMRVLELRDAEIAAQLERSLDTTSFGGPVNRITSFREGGDVKIIVASSGDPSTLELDREGNRLVWTFPKSKRTAPASASAQQGQLAAAGGAPQPQAGEGAPVEHSEVVSLGGTKVSGFSTPPVMAARGGTKLGGRSRWRGEPIDIELQDAPIKDVLLLFSDIGRVNIIAGPEVQGTVTMKLSAVPWDQALDIILRSLNLGMVQEGNVIRVATQATLEDERRKAIEEANARVQLKPLETRLISLSYADVGDMLPKVQSVLSSRGTVTPDTRTNTLIVMDVAENIALAESLVRQLDSQTPQVLIEARIVEARTNWLRQLGIQWGFDFVASPGTGNPTGLLFPNAIGIGGGSGSNQSPVNGLILPGAAANPNYAVDLPAVVGTGSGGALGFSFGSLSGNLNTNLRLSAAENEGDVRIISAPKIVTLDNTEAQIEQGVQIPIAQVSAQGVNTRYVNATLGLRVTPQVTNEGAVLLEVEVQKNEADFVNTGARGDPTILTKSARSQLLITDGDTAVIGGIYTRNQAINHSKVPWFADIPIIGWFFKNRTERDDRSEMLIFLTPRIVNRSESIGG